MPTSDRPVLAVTIGDPAGIGPDVCAQALGRDHKCDLVFVGDARSLRDRAKALGIRCELGGRGQAGFADVPVGSDVVPGEPDPRHAPGILAALDKAAAMARGHVVDGIVTAPVAKHLLADASPGFAGQTGYLASLAGVDTAVMAMVGSRLKVAFATTHLPLREVPQAISAGLVRDTLVVADRDMRSGLGVASPSWIVLGLNPHAGEKGLLGDEESSAILPGIEMAKKEGVDARGPVPADTAFLPGALEEGDMVLAMYHDQALPVVKRDDFHGTVNTTLGLPFVRTSPDHGTAHHLAGTGGADPRAMLAAINLAGEIAARKKSAS